MDHGNMAGMDHGDMDMNSSEGMSGMDHSNMEGMDHGSMAMGKGGQSDTAVPQLAASQGEPHLRFALFTSPRVRIEDLRQGSAVEQT